MLTTDPEGSGHEEIALLMARPQSDKSRRERPQRDRCINYDALRRWTQKEIVVPVARPQDNKLRKKRPQKTDLSVTKA